MADNQFNIKIVVTDNGGTKLAEKNIQSLGTAVERTGKQYKQSSKDSGDFYDKQAKGVIGTANSTRSFSKLASTMNDSRGIVGAYAELAANVFAVTAAFNALRNAAQVEQIFKGLEAAGVRSGRALTGTSKALKQVTGDAISTEQAMRSTAQIIAAGFNTDAVLRLGRVAKDVSFALGRNLPDSIDRLSRGIVKLEPELLDELGIMTKLTESNRAYALSLGKTEANLTSFEKRQGFMNAVLSEAELKFGGLSKAAGNSTGYDKLSATFFDSANEALNFLNKGLLPVANALASSPGALVGVTLLFASTLKNMIPGLNDAAQRTASLASSLREKTKAEQADIVVARNNVKARIASNITRLAEIDYVGSKAPKAYAKLSESIREGTAAPAEYTKAIVSLNRSITANEALMKNNSAFNENTSRGQDKLQEIANLRAQSTAIANLQLERSKSSYTEIENDKKVITARKEAVAARLNASKAQSTANALEAASNFNLISGYSGLRTAMISAASAGRAHTLMLISTTQAATGSTASLSRLTVAMYSVRGAAVAASVGVRAFGVALLSALPMIGLVVAAFGILVSVWDSFKSDRTKKLEEAFTRLSEVTSKTNDYTKEMLRIENSTASTAQKTTQQMILKSNAINEVVASYKAVREAAKAAENAESNEIVGKEKVSSFFNLEGSQGSLSNALGIEKDSKILTAFRKDLAQTSGTFGAFSLNEEIAGAAIALNSLAKSSPEVVKEMARINGGWEKFGQLSPEKKLLAVDKAIQESENKYGGLAIAVEEINQSFKTLDDSLAKFAISALPSTPFDEVVKGFDGVKNSIQELEDQGEKLNSSNWKNILGGIGSNTLNFINPAVKQQLSEYEKAAAQINQYEQGKLSLDAEALSNAKQKVSQQGILFDKVRDELDITSKLFQQAQAAVVLDQSRGALLSARLNTLSTIYSMTGAGLSAQFKQEEAVRETQTNQLRIQQSLNNVQISNIEASIELTIKENERLIIAEKLKKVTLEHLLIQFRMINAISGAGDNEAIKSTIAQITELDTKIAGIEKSSTRNIERGVAQVRQIQLANQALSNQIATILEAAPSAAEKIARIAVLNVKNNNELLSNLVAQRSVVLKTNENYSEINDIINGTTDSISNQIRILDQQYEKQRVETKRQTDGAILTAKANLDSVKATAARAGVDAEAGKAAIALSQQQLSLAQTEQNIQLKLIESEYQKAIAAKVYFDTVKDGLEWQKTALDYVERELSVAKSLREENEKLYQSKVKLAYKRAGLEISDEGNNALEIRSATQAYEIAVQEVSLKKSLIDLEYALLAAQRDQLIEDLKIRRSAIDASDPRNATRVAQLDSSLEKLNRVNIDTVSENAKAVLDKQVEQARINLQTAITKEAVPTLFSKIVSGMRGAREERTAKREAQEILERLRGKEKGSAEIIVRGDTEAEKRALSQTVNPIIQSNDLLIASINKWINTIEVALKLTKTDFTSLSGGKGSLSDAQKYSANNGIRISEYIGKLTGGHKGAGHREGRAFDATIAAGNLDSTNPTYKRKMDAQAELFQSQGLIVLWNGKRYDPSGAVTQIAKDAHQHLDHMHVEISATASKVVKDVETLGITMAKIAAENVKASIDSAHAAVESATLSSSNQAANNNSSQEQSTITVTGNTDAKKDNSSIKNEPKDFSALEEALSTYRLLTSDTIENLKQLGPEGEAIAAVFAGIESISQAALNAMKIFNDLGSTASDRFTAIAGVVSSALSTIQSVLNASAQAKEASIQREIDAETRRDGKSAESVSKIAGLEKRKEEINKKQFNTNKKLMMAQAVIATATGITQALSLPVPLNFIMAGIVGAMGAAQLAIIAGTSYQSASANTANSAASVPSLNIGKRGDTVDLAKQNNNLGGEIGYLRGERGTGSNSSNFATIGSAYGGELPRGYGSSAYVVGEKGPETITPETPITVRPANDNLNGGSPLNATFHINAIDSRGMAEALNDQKGNIISMLREAANANGQNFLESVDVNVYTRPNVSRL